MERRATTAKERRRNPQGRGAGAKERSPGWSSPTEGAGRGLAWVGSEGRGQKARVKPLRRRSERRGTGARVKALGVQSEGRGAGARVRPLRVWSKGLGAGAEGKGQAPESVA